MPLSARALAFIVCLIAGHTVSLAMPLETRQDGRIPPSQATEFDTSTNECNIPDKTSILTSSLNFGASAKNGAAANGMCGNHADVTLVDANGNAQGKAVDVTSVGFCTDCTINDVKLSDAALQALGVDPSKGPFEVIVEF